MPVILSQSEMWPLSCCWYAEWTQLSDTSKYCNYPENGSHKEEVCQTRTSKHSSGFHARSNGTRPRTDPFYFTSERKVVFLELNEVAASAASVGGVWEVWPCFVPCRWSECKGTPLFKLNRAVLLKPALNCKTIVFWRVLWIHWGLNNEGILTWNDPLSLWVKFQRFKAL